jgi:hypothetical protein
VVVGIRGAAQQVESRALFGERLVAEVDPVASEHVERDELCGRHDDQPLDLATQLSGLRHRPSARP